MLIMLYPLEIPKGPALKEFLKKVIVPSFFFLRPRACDSMSSDTLISLPATKPIIPQSDPKSDSIWITRNSFDAGPLGISKESDNVSSASSSSYYNPSTFFAIVNKNLNDRYQLAWDIIIANPNVIHVNNADDAITHLVQHSVDDHETIGENNLYGISYMIKPFNAIAVYVVLLLSHVPLLCETTDGGSHQHVIIRQILVEKPCSGGAGAMLKSIREAATRHKHCLMLQTVTMMKVFARLNGMRPRVHGTNEFVICTSKAYNIKKTNEE